MKEAVARETAALRREIAEVRSALAKNASERTQREEDLARVAREKACLPSRAGLVVWGVVWFVVTLLVAAPTWVVLDRAYGKFSMGAHGNAEEARYAAPEKLRAVLSRVDAPPDDFATDLVALRQALLPASVRGPGAPPHSLWLQHSGGEGEWLGADDRVLRWVQVGVAACRVGERDLALFSMSALGWTEELSGGAVAREAALGRTRVSRACHASSVDLARQPSFDRDLIARAVRPHPR